MSLEQMMKQHPEATKVDLDALVECIERCSAWEAACVSCADACLREAGVQQLVDCIRLNLDCADLCGVTVRLLSRHSSREPGADGAVFMVVSVPLALLRARDAGDDARQKGAAAPNRAKTCARFCHAILTSAHDQSRNTNKQQTL